MNDLGLSREAALLLRLLLGLQQSAMISLGKLTNPITGRIAVDLETARDTIDTLSAIENRTRGNLGTEEARSLQQILSQLRLNYVDEVKKAGVPQPRSGVAGDGAPAGDV
jgi:hypothetical protein